MKKYAHLQEQVRGLRRRGRSYGEIAQELSVAKSTVSLWCRDVPLAKKYRDRFYTQQIAILSFGPQSSRERRQRELQGIITRAKNQVEKISPEEIRVAGTMLYLAEGSKGRHSGTSLTNSDPRIIVFMVRWFYEVFGLAPNQLGAAIHYHEGAQEKEIRQYWSHLTEIPLANFTKSFLKPKGTGHRKNVLPNGIIRIRVRGKGGEDIRHTILSWGDVYLSAPTLRP